jgi:hypothetical protein
MNIFCFFFLIFFLFWNEFECLKSQFTYYKLSILLFSGTDDPVFYIDSHKYDHIVKILKSSKFFQSNINKNILGYRGFIISTQTYYNKNSFIVFGFPQAEIYLLNLIKKKLDLKFYDYIKNCINESKPKVENMVMIQKSSKKLNDFDENNCLFTPMIGPDKEPQFQNRNLLHLCFTIKRKENNCYNYAVNILTNSFAQPGRGSSKKFKKYTCASIRKAAISDGLKYIGKSYPNLRPRYGHYAALLVWNKTNFHWLRKDSNGYWSHKPGKKTVNNMDNNGNLITNPKRQNFYPYSNFCGYFWVISSKIKLN